MEALTTGPALEVNAQFVAGVCVFFMGLGINWHADHVLINLRKPGETGYKIPHVSAADVVARSAAVSDCEIGGDV